VTCSGRYVGERIDANTGRSIYPQDAEGQCKGDDGT
jgi:hypothetical protein